MKRIFFILVGVIIGAVATATVISVRAGNGSDPVTIAAGNAHATNNVTACSAIGGGGGSCTIKVSGDYFSYGVLGNGKYAGTLTIDWSTYALNSQNNEMCASISGPLTYTTGSSVLKVMETGGASVSGNFPNSTICETSNTPPASPFDRDYNFNGQVVSGNGKFKKVIASSSNVFENGQQFAQMNGSVANGTYLDSPNLNPSLNFS